MIIFAIYHLIRPYTLPMQRTLLWIDWLLQYFLQTVRLFCVGQINFRSPRWGPRTPCLPSLDTVVCPPLQTRPPPLHYNHLHVSYFIRHFKELFSGMQICIDWMLLTQYIVETKFCLVRVFF